MAKYHWTAAATDRTILIFIQDSSSGTGAGKASLVAANLNCRFIRVETDNDVTIAQLALTDLANLTAAHSDGGIFPVDNTNAPGWYRLDLSDAVLAAGAWQVGLSIIDAGSNNVAPWAAEIQLDPAPTNVTSIAAGVIVDATLDATAINEIADGLLDRADGVEVGLTPRNALRLALAVLAGKISGAGTGTELLRNAIADSKNRITATVDSSGNRTAIVTDLT